MGWGCYRHQWDAGSDAWKEAVEKLCKAKLREPIPRTFGRDLEVCPACWTELEERHRVLVTLCRQIERRVEDGEDLAPLLYSLSIHLGQEP